LRKSMKIDRSRERRQIFYEPENGKGLCRTAGSPARPAGDRIWKMPTPHHFRRARKYKGALVSSHERYGGDEGRDCRPLLPSLRDRRVLPGREAVAWTRVGVMENRNEPGRHFVVCYPWHFLP